MTKIVSREFGITKDGRKVTVFNLSNGNGMTVRILDYGCTVQSVVFQGADVVLGYPDIASYEKGDCFLGAIVGRYANRIKKGRFILEGKEYRLRKNQAGNHLHGIFSKVVFEASIEGGSLCFHHLSSESEEGYPGNLDVKVHYTLTDDNALRIDYEATTDKTTIVNLTNHSYFNLNGQDNSTVLNHKLRLNCSAFTEFDEVFTPTGKVLSVEDTPLDFRKEHTLGERIEDDYPQLRMCHGYDHNMILDGEVGELEPIGILIGDKTGIILEAFTTEPAIQLYSANYLKGKTRLNGKGGVPYPNRGGLCLEAQHYPDSINHPEFPSTVLHPGETYRQQTVYRFRAKQK